MNVIAPHDSPEDQGTPHDAPNADAPKADAPNGVDTDDKEPRKSGGNTVKTTSGSEDPDSPTSSVTALPDTAPTILTMASVTLQDLPFHAQNPEALANVMRIVRVSDVENSENDDATRPYPVDFTGTVTLHSKRQECTLVTFEGAVAILSGGDSGGQPSKLSGTAVSVKPGAFKPMLKKQVAKDFARSASVAPSPDSSSSSSSTEKNRAVANFGSSSTNMSVAASNLLDQVLSSVKMLHTKHARYRCVDSGLRDDFITNIPRTPAPQPHEQALVDETLRNYDLLNTAWRPKKSKDAVSYSLNDTSTGRWGRGRAPVDASAEATLAWLWSLTSYERMPSSKGALRKMLLVPNSHSSLYVYLMPLRLKNVHDRVFSNWFCWTKMEDGSFVIAFAPIDEHPNKDYKVELDAVINSDKKASLATAGTTRGFWRIIPVANNVCEVEYVVQGRLNGEQAPNDLHRDVNPFYHALPTFLASSLTD
jgi:hypothetical protein